MSRKNYKDAQNHKNFLYETAMINDCLDSIDRTQQQKHNDKMRAKKHWEDELHRTQNWNSIKSKLDL